MNCTNCGAENDSGRKFCLECGQRLAVACPTCGTANPASARFCGECGGQLNATDSPAAAAPATITPPNPTAPAQPASAPSPVTERRLVSVLFADLVGFTTISESRDAEDVRALLHRYFDTSREVVERYGGTVEKFIGDAVMAVWGTPTAQEDDAERAVRAALDLVDAARQLGEQSGVAHLSLRAGVLTGEAVVAIGATGMGMVAGDLVNTASRLQSVAPPGTVLVGEGTRRAASEAIVFEPAGEHALKGKVAPVPAFRALRVVAQRGGVGRSELLEPPFVGRDAELRLIKDFYHATARDRGARLVSVIGQAGIGKSRLAWEFLKYIDGVTEIVHWHEGRSPAYGEGISFWALGEMVRMRAGIGEGDDPATTRERIAATLDEFVPDPAERETLEGPLLHLLGVSEGPQRDRGTLFVAWRTFFERVAEQGPVVMVFEDLQWADDGLLDFIEELVTWSRGRSIYVISLSRPELIDRRPNWGAGLRSFTSLSLAPLADSDVAALLNGLVPGLPAKLTRAIVARAEGVPLYAVETVRMLLNDGRIEREGDAYRPIGELDELAVPESLHALIAARIDALPAEERALLQDAAVLGQSFSRPALVAVTREPDVDMELMLRHLAQRELITIDDDPRSPERGNYRFVQGLLREVAYGTLSRDDRRARHLAAARYYEGIGDDELAGVLAQHYVDAYQAHTEGPEGAAVAAQARVALRAAAHRAAALGSHDTARRYLVSALSVTDDPREELELNMLAGYAAADAGRLDASVGHYERAVELARRVGDDGTRRRATAQLGNVLTEGRQTDARAILTELLGEPGFSESDPEYLRAAAILAKLEMRSQHDAEAVVLADRILPGLEGAGEEELALDVLVTRGVALANMDRNLEAIVVLTGALEQARRLSYDDVAHRTYTNVGYALGTDDPAATFSISREGYELAATTGKIWAIRYVLGNALDAAFEVGEWDWLMEAAAEQADPTNEPAERLWYATHPISVRAFRGEDVTEEARAIYLETRKVDDPQHRLLGMFAATYSALARGDLDACVALGEEAISLGPIGVEAAIPAARAAAWQGDLPKTRTFATAFGAARSGRRNRAHRRAMDGALAILEGHPQDARAAFGEAQRLFRELSLAPSLGFCDLDIVILGAMEPDERRRAADEARQLFTTLGAVTLLRRLEAALETNEPVAAAHGAPSTVVPEGMEIGREA